VRNFSTAGSSTVDVADLPAGVYIVHIIGSQALTRKVVVQ